MEQDFSEKSVDKKSIGYYTYSRVIIENEIGS